mmetsp:Transcript_3050/g.8025  ORF Transcript_3050/g.8025 Transcript_3050/m.8025 type:complete len:312 (+) Transcript_3050:2970-3905(+)
MRAACASAGTRSDMTRGSTPVACGEWRVVSSLDPQLHKLLRLRHATPMALSAFKPWKFTCGSGACGIPLPVRANRACSLSPPVPSPLPPAEAAPAGPPPPKLTTLSEPPVPARDSASTCCSYSRGGCCCCCCCSASEISRDAAASCFITAAHSASATSTTRTPAALSSQRLSTRSPIGVSCCCCVRLPLLLPGSVALGRGWQKSSGLSSSTATGDAAPCCIACGMRLSLLVNVALLLLVLSMLPLLPLPSMPLGSCSLLLLPRPLAAQLLWCTAPAITNRPSATSSCCIVGELRPWPRSTEDRVEASIRVL